MHLKSITLRGFKSFAKTTELLFEPGITAIIGPNGSGKSNIVDALSWVMGEQGAKNQRAQSMQDVIFSGSKEKRELGRAEVKILLDNSDQKLPLDYTEIEISRLLFRNGGSQYKINGQNVRLLDVLELLSDAGLGQMMHIIVGQGRLESILQSSADDKRFYIEEAANVAKHKMRKNRSLSKLDAIEKDVFRLQDIKIEIEKQLSPLNRQAKTAKRAGDIQARLREIAAILYVNEYNTLRLTAEKLQSEIAENTEKLGALHGNQTVISEKIAEIERFDFENNPEIDSLQQTWYRLTNLEAKFQSLLQTATNEQAILISNANQFNETQLTEKAENTKQKLTDLDIEIVKITQNLAKLDANLAKVRTELESAKQEYTTAELKESAQKKIIQDKREGIANINGQLDTLNERIATLKTTITENKTKLETETKTLETLETTANEALSATQKSESAIQNATQRNTETSAKLDAMLAKLNEKKSKITDINVEIQKVTTKMRVLESELVPKDVSKTLIDSKKLYAKGIVSTLIKITHGYEKAINAALREFHDSVVVESVNTAVDAILMTNSDELGTISMLIAQNTNAQNTHKKHANLTYVTDFIENLNDINLSFAGTILANYVYAENLNDARNILQNATDVTVVTKNGDIISNQFAKSGGRKNTTLFELNREFDDCKVSLKNLENELETENKALSGIQSEFDKKNADFTSAQQQLSALREAVENENKQLRKAEYDRDIQKSRVTQMEAEIVSSTQELESLHKNVDELAIRRKNFELNPQEAARQEIVLEKEAEIARKKYLDAEKIVQSVLAEVQLATQQKELLEREKQTAEGDIQALDDEKQRSIEQSIQQNEKLNRIKNAIPVVKQCIEKIGVSIKNVMETQTEASEKKSANATLLRDYRLEFSNINAELQKINEPLQKLQIDHAVNKNSIQSLKDRIQREQSADLDALIAVYGKKLETENIDEIADEQEELTRKLRNLGKINPLALEEFSALEKRYQFLNQELQDVIKARLDLLDIIKSIDEYVSDEFKSAFHDIAENFERIFSLLFPGGIGKITLENPDDILNSGVLIEVAPAGKKLKHINLLSGGEKSLSAFAFLVAIFEARPSPFYILDEIEAALDDINTERLLNLLETLKRHAQLIIVTHHKRTIEIADALYGVTMKGDGISKVVSQKLG
ncbi:MAG: chromosome segregation protein SMC [Bifidobacteriaceae bacterium]|jgi:chromosome segregation protein|nr:chromosome segregation protein SMC [Bifidobacteriaceae bacterium]